MRIGQNSLVLTALLCIVVMSCHSKSPESSSVQGKSAANQSNIQSKHSSITKEDSPSWNALCSVEGSEFKIRFRSQTGDLTNDDMVTTVEWQDGTFATIPLKPGWFVPKDEIASDIPNVCRGIIGHALPHYQVLLWVSRNDRPNPDRLAMLLLNTSTKQILDIQNDVGEIAEPYMIVSRPQGCSILILQDWRQSTNGGEFGVPEWMQINIRNNRIFFSFSKIKTHY
jgi:hypothetical protein